MNTLLCSKCELYLSVPPITYKDGFLCGRCSTTNENRILCYELIAGKHIFPCRYKVNGCKELRLFDTIGRHEVHCDKRVLNCPVCESPIVECELERHLIEVHSSIIADSRLLSLNLNELTILRLIEEYDRLFFVQCKTKGEYLLVKVFHIGKNYDQACVNYKISLHTKCMSQSLNFAKKEIQRYGYEDNSAYTTEIQLKLVRFFENETIWLQVDVAPELGTIERAVHQSYLQLLECPICFDHMSDAKQCNNGHTFCRKCLEKVKICPICQCELTGDIANYLTNALYQQTLLPCTNAPYCRFMGRHSSREEHMKKCFLCPAINCSMYGTVDILAEHCLVEHQVLFNDIQNGICRLSMKRAMVLFYIENRVFKYCRLCDEHFIYFNVMLVGPRTEAEQFEFKVQIVNEKKVWTFKEKCRPLENNYGDKNMYFKLALQWLKSFIKSDNSFTCNISVCRIK